MRRTFIAAATAATLTLGASAALAGPPPWAGPGLDTTTVETAVALSGTPFEFDDNAGDFDILVAAVVATGVNESILNGEEDYTVFAPTDQAFLDVVSAIAGTTVTDEEFAFNALVDTLGVDGVTAVLAYHVTEDWRPSPSVVNAKKIEMLDGNTISARGGTIVANNSTAGFVATDVKTADGGIHVIDAVLLP